MARDFLGENPNILIDGDPVYPGYQTAEQTSVGTSEFTHILSIADDNVQKCFNKLDKISRYHDGGRANEIYYGCRVIDGGGANG
jgi:hypothetical protein